MTSLIVLGLVAVLLLQAMRTLPGTHLVLAGLLSLALLWPLRKWLVKGEVAHQVVHGVTLNVTPSSNLDTKAIQKPSLACRVWQKMDTDKKSGLVRAHIRQRCVQEHFE
jgi:hypothetical protein